jgi:hypothetical protein
MSACPADTILISTTMRDSKHNRLPTWHGHLFNHFPGLIPNIKTAAPYTHVARI